MENYLNDIKPSIDIIYLFQTKNISTLKKTSSLANLDTTAVYYDIHNNFENKNKFIKKCGFNTFLLDKNNKIILAGSPLYNFKLWELYKNTISELNNGKDIIISQNIIPLTTIQFKQDSIYLENISFNEKNTLNFNFTNTGQNPLIIKGVVPSCGCIDVKWPKHPILPKESGKIQITFEANSFGKFSKSVEIICNTVQKIYILKLFGYINKK